MPEERRRFFRIDDEAEISFKTLSDEELSTWQEAQNNNADNDLAKLETELGISIVQLKSQQPQLGKIFELLNQKINLAMGRDNSTQGFIDSGELKSINLSACGIAFHSDEILECNQGILLQMKLKPSNVSIITTGKVISSDNSQDQSIVRVDFHELSDSHQDLLMQHLFQVQSRALKKQRDDKNSNQ